MYKIKHKKKPSVKKAYIRDSEVQKALRQVKDSLTEVVAINTQERLTFSGETIDENSPGHLDWKEEMGYSTSPMQMKDYDFVNPSKMFEYGVLGRNRFLIFPHSRLHQKYLDIIEVSNYTRKNYKEVFPQTDEESEMMWFVETTHIHLRDILMLRGIRLKSKTIKI